ncbi:hypothetical protein C5167_007074 [Papaver somniferum]|uniref:Helicase C-terminal domain-containing protein n=1 Tax=Papaver somniferum TaxID=3469 RepID=A0A4Y7JF53_PAPSO|nr:hypothetical protein C5167_007074 [Papaver somniferum]
MKYLKSRLQCMLYFMHCVLASFWKLLKYWCQRICKPLPCTLLFVEYFVRLPTFSLITFLFARQYIKLTELEKNCKLNDLLDTLDFKQVVICVKSVSRAAALNNLPVECDSQSVCIHSGMSQEERFKRGLR